MFVNLRCVLLQQPDSETLIFWYIQKQLPYYVVVKSVKSLNSVSFKSLNITNITVLTSLRPNMFWWNLDIIFPMHAEELDFTWCW